MGSGLDFTQKNYFKNWLRDSSEQDSFTAERSRLKALGVPPSDVWLLLYDRYDHDGPGLEPRQRKLLDEYTNGRMAEYESGVSDEDIPIVDPETSMKRGKIADLLKDAEWVYGHLADEKCDLRSAPTRGAWAMREWALEKRTEFFTMLQKLRDFELKKPKNAEEELKDASTGELMKVIGKIKEIGEEAKKKSGD